MQNNTSVVVSLRLLPKLFQSFHNFPGSDTHEMILYTEKTHEMTKLFFENLQRYSSERKMKACFSSIAHLPSTLERLFLFHLVNGWGLATTAERDKNPNNYGKKW